jgi:Ca-activated chloride channel family protein
MKSVRYSRYTGEDLGIDAEDLLQALADFLLGSGFNSQYMPFSELNEHTLEDLKNAIQRALEQGDLFDNDALQEMMERIQNMSPEQMDQLLDRLVQKLIDEGHITVEEAGDQQAPGAGDGRDSQRRASKSPISRSIFWDSKRSRTCSARWANRASAATTRAIWPPAWRPRVRPKPMSSATR